MTFKILFNNAKPGAIDAADNVMNEPTAAEPIDLDVVAQQRSNIKAAPEQPKKLGTEKTLGRKRQR